MALCVVLTIIATKTTRPNANDIIVWLPNVQAPHAKKFSRKIPVDGEMERKKLSRMWGKFWDDVDGKQCRRNRFKFQFELLAQVEVKRSLSSETIQISQLQSSQANLTWAAVFLQLRSFYRLDSQFPSHLAPTQSKIRGNSMDVPVQLVRMIPNIVQNDSMKLGILTQSFGSRSIWHTINFIHFDQEWFER